MAGVSLLHYYSAQAPRSLSRGIHFRKLPCRISKRLWLTAKNFLEYR